MNNVNDLDELIALINYLVNHNKAHNDELRELALKLDAAKNKEAYDEIASKISSYASLFLAAISIYDRANCKLEDALKKVRK